MPREPKVPPSPSLLSLEPDWRRELSVKHLRPLTVQTYLDRFYMFCTWLSPDGKPEHCTATLADITRQTIQEYFAWLYENRAENTVLNVHIALTQFFNMAIDYGAMERGTNPLQWVKRPQPRIDAPPILSPEQIKRLLATCSNDRSFKGLRDYALLRVFLSTGLRRRELASIALADVDLPNGFIHVPNGKGGKARTVPIGEQTAKAIRKYMFARDRHPHAKLPTLWLSQRGAISEHRVYTVVTDRAREAQLEGIHPHAFRHWFSHGFLVATRGDESDLKTIAGWTSSRMLERYGASMAKERAIEIAHKARVGEFD